MNEYKFKWDMTEERFKNLKTAIKTQNDTEGCYGNVYIGNYCIDIAFVYDSVNLDFYHIGIASGYGYTKGRQTPYDFEEGPGWDLKTIDFLKLSFDDFKSKSEEMIIEEFKLDVKRFCDEHFLEKEVFCELADWS